MKQLYEGLANVLLNDADLKEMVGYTKADPNIRRGSMPFDFKKRAVIFYLQPELVIADFEQRIRTVPVIVRVYDREDDLNCDDIGERVILLLDGSDLSVEGCHMYDCSYAGELIATNWNEDLKTWEKVLRFDVVFRSDTIVGNNGLPTTYRQ